MKKVIYIAGPFRGRNAWEIECNIRRAESLAMSVWHLGGAAICPHANTRYFQGLLDDGVWLAGDLAILEKCDAVVLTDNWITSSGAVDEVIFAVEHDIPVFEYLIKFRNWLDYGIDLENQTALKQKALQRREANRAEARARAESQG